MRRLTMGTLAAIMALQAVAATPVLGQDGQGPLREVCVVVVVAASTPDEDIARLLAAGEAAIITDPVACDSGGLGHLEAEADGAIEIDEPVEGLRDVERVPWDRLAFHPDGRSVDIHFMAGPPPCTDLDRVEVVPSPGGLDIRVFVGMPPEARACPGIAGKYVVTVELETTLFAGGLEP